MCKKENLVHMPSNCITSGRIHPRGGGDCLAIVCYFTNFRGGCLNFPLFVKKKSVVYKSMAYLIYGPVCHIISPLIFMRVCTQKGEIYLKVQI